MFPQEQIERRIKMFTNGILMISLFTLFGRRDISKTVTPFKKEMLHALYIKFNLLFLLDAVETIVSGSLRYIFSTNFIIIGQGILLVRKRLIQNGVFSYSLFMYTYRQIDRQASCKIYAFGTQLIQNFECVINTTKTTTMCSLV